jgi:hypothetical protein
VLTGVRAVPSPPASPRQKALLATRSSTYSTSLTVSSPAPGLAPAPPSPAEVWLSVCNDLLWGFNHALSNRLAALTSIVRILEHSDTGLDPLLGVLSEEIGNLERTLSLLRLLPQNPAEAPEAVLLQDLIPPLLELHRLQNDGRDLEFDLDLDSTTFPVWVEPSALSHAILLLLAATSRAARRAGSTAVSIRYHGNERSVALAIATLPSEGNGELGEDSWMPIDTRVVERLLDPTGGELVKEYGAGDPREGARFELRLPTLLEVREREQRAKIVGEE